MAIRGTYTKAEEDMLAEWREKTDKLEGWLGETPSEEVPYPVFHRVATKELILHMAYAADYWNPLWRDESYARNTRWGGIIAPPFFQHCISHGGPTYYPLKVPPEVGVGIATFGGEYWDFFKPIYVNDSFRVWVDRPTIQDVTGPGEASPRKFRTIGNVSYINQRDEVTCVFHRVIPTIILPPKTKENRKEFDKLAKEYVYTKEENLKARESRHKFNKFAKEYVYTKEEIEAIDRIADAEEIRGNKPRYWEDVKVGDELKPVVQGPLTVWDEVVEIQGFGLAVLPMREVRRQQPDRIVIDPVTNIPHKSIEIHLIERTAQMDGMPSTTILGVTVEHFLARLITNWMGDDGFIRQFNWDLLVDVPIGDTIFGRGRVTRKYVDEDGNHLIDLDVWMESVRGYIPNVAMATVSLISKEKVFK